MKCIRCSTCVKVCPTSAIGFNPITEEKPSVDVSKCILCELCGSHCPTGAIAVLCNLPIRRLERHTINVNRDMCIGCSLCVEACKVALKGDHAPYIKDGLAYINETKCIGCGACAATCPAECIKVIKFYSPKVVAGRAEEVVVIP
ncbi:MAG: 4Fe-4S binding protein [Candidatus Methanomethylicaceae archaeon]